REPCLALNYELTDTALPALATLADRYDGQDRWYLEALGIGAAGRESELLESWQKGGKNKDPKVVEGITWRLKKQEPGTAEAPAQGKGRADAAGKSGGAAAELPPQRSKDGRTLPPIAELAKLHGDPVNGALVFRNTTGANC